MIKKKKKKIEFNLKDIIEKEIKDNSLRSYFPKSFELISKSLIKKNIKGHKDFTNIPFVTIDGEDSKDFDDAVWSINENNSSKIMIAISDVSFFIKKNDPLDIEAKKRGNSFYFPDRVIPMFPEEISNNICSLVPNKVRACIVVEIEINNYEITSFKIHRAKIISTARLTYQETDEIYKKNLIKNKNFIIIKNLFETYKKLKKISERRNKINFSSEEFQIVEKINKDFFLKKKENLESYKLIEEFMILANENVAKYLKSNNLTSIFRNHEKPKDEKIKDLQKLLKENKIYNNEKFNNQKDFIKILGRIDKSNTFINDLLLRSQSKAYYDNKNIGHFGLGLDYYTHFTSPIRRYSDLNVHRDLIDHFFDKKKNNHEYSLSEHLTIQEKKSESIERKVMEKACSLYIKNSKKKNFIGIIDGIESFGIFIRSIDLPFSCLARIKYKSFKKKEDYRKPSIDYKIGQKVSFKIKRNDISSGKILAHNVKLI